MVDLSPEARQAVRTFWRAAKNRNPRLRQIYLDAVGMIQEEMFNDQLPKGDNPMRCKCGHTGPAEDFTNPRGKLTKMCGPCREVWGAKRRRKKKSATTPLAITPPSRDLAPPQPVQAITPEPAVNGDTITLTLTPGQAEKLVELTLRRIVERDPGRLTKALPALVDLLD